MKLSVSAFRAQASAQRKILTSYQNPFNYGACNTFPPLKGCKLDDKLQMLVDGTRIGPPTSGNPNDTIRSPNTSREMENEATETADNKKEKAVESGGNEGTNQGRRDDGLDKSPGRTRTKSNQRWMKLRTTVQLSGAITNQNQKSKPGLKREDSFLKRFSTRQIPETQETVDTGDDTETANGPQTHNEKTRRRRKRRKELSKTVVNPDENFYFYWLMTVTVCVLYNLWTLIVRQSFPELQKEASRFWHAGDGFTDLIFVCDIVVQFRTGYLEQGLMVYDSKKLASHYLKSRAFLLDILSLLPLDFLQWKLGVNPILRFPRFLKIYRIYSYYYMVESRTVYPNLWRVVNLIHILLILAHWFGCFYYLLSEAENFQGDWVYPYRPGDYATLTRKYLGSLYWSTLTLTTIGDLPTPETNAESRGGSKGMTSTGDPHSIPRRGHKSRLLQFNSNYGYLFTIVSYLIGVFIFATIVGQVGNVITNRNANRLEFERLLDGAKTYMRHHKVPGGMKRRVLRWYDYSWSRGRIQGGGDINTALGLLPDKLKTELALHVNLSVLKKVTIFQECQPEFLHDLVLKMKAYIFTPGDLICRKGEVAREMFIIADGILDVISETGRVLTTMKAGDFFGEIGILNLDGLNKRTADVRSVGYSELFSLSREDVLTAMKDYPEAQEILQNLGRKRLMEAKNASKMHKIQAAKQNKEYDSSGDSDNAGKRIVEKLRSDVKGLKNALRRSRRGTRTKADLNGSADISGERIQGKKQSILRRMSHVQSSDEFEGSSEMVQSSIGVGLPLLQRLKCLKEREKEKEKEDKTRLSQNFQSPYDREDYSEFGSIKRDLFLPQKVKLMKEKKEITASSHFTPINLATTVRTQQTGFNAYASKINEITVSKSDKDGNQERLEESGSATIKETGESKKFPFIEKIRLGVKDKSSNLKNVQEPLLSSDSILKSETYIETSKNLPAAAFIMGSSEAVNIVPKSSLINKYEVPRSKEAWKILKKSSMTSSRLKLLGRYPIRKVTAKGTYLSKSDTVLEREKTLEKDEEKRSRSISSSENSNFTEKSVKMYESGNDLNLVKDSNQIKLKLFEERDSSSRGNLPQGHVWKSLKGLDCSLEGYGFMKKYDSISDLSPEYSGLPFVKKLKILNERQKLAELEKELVVRSASLDVPGTQSGRCVNVLIRSQSEASTIEIKNQNSEKIEESNGKSKLLISYQDHISDTTDLRKLMLTEKQNLEEPMASPESNETMERRHLKSILKKLSAEEKSSDEGIAKADLKIMDNAELKKLMRALTIEGYVARHKKLTKSVTFDSDTLPSSPECDSFSKGIISDENYAKGSKELDKTEMIEQEEAEEGVTKDWDVFDIETVVSKILRRLEEKMEILQKNEKIQKEENLQCQGLNFADQNFQILPFADTQSFEFFNENVLGVKKIFPEDLAKIESQHQIERAILEMEIQKRDEFIQQLQAKLQEFEQKQNSSVEKSMEFLNQIHFNERMDHSEDVAISSAISEKGFSSLEVHQSTRFQNYGPRSNFDLKRLGSTSKSQETENNSFEMKEKIYLLSEDNMKCLQKSFQNTLENTSEDDECEILEAVDFQHLEEFQKNFYKPDFQLKNNWTTEEYPLDSTSRYQGHWSGQTKGSNDHKNSQNCFAGSQTANFNRTFSCTQDKEFYALDMDDDSTSSDTEQPQNKDWEIQMLVEEMEKKEKLRLESDWNEENRMTGERNVNSVENLEDVKRLQREVNTLKQMVCQSDLTKLSNSELDMLETIIEAKDCKISQIAKSNSLDEADDKVMHFQGKPMGFGASEGDKSVLTQKKPTFRQKLGKTLSFDSHDIERRKSESQEQRRINPLSIKDRKNVSWDDSGGMWPNSDYVKNYNQSQARSSLPILISNSLRFEENFHVKTSLPSLIAENANLLECLVSSASSSEETVCESVLKQNKDSAFEISNSSCNLATSPTAKSPQESHSNASGLNNFIKSVGQKMKHAMTGEDGKVTTVKNQVPTISRLCDQIPSVPSSKITDFGKKEEEMGNEKKEEIPMVKSNSDRNVSFSHKIEPTDL